MTGHRPRHETFDAMWAGNKGLVYHMAKRLAPGFGTTPQEILGSLVLVFAHCLHSFDPAKGKFSSYFCKWCWRYVFKNWMRYESQAWSNLVKSKTSNNSDSSESERNFASHEIDFHLYRVPEEDETDAGRVVEFFDSAGECWEFMTRSLPKRDKEMLSLYYRDDWTLQQIGDKFHLTRERIRQILDRAKEGIKKRLRLVQDFADLFGGQLQDGDDS